MKKIVILLFALSVLLSFPLTAYGHDVPVERDDCTIEVIVRYGGENVDGGTLTAVKVGYVAEDDGNYFFAQEFTGTKIEDVTSPNAPAVQKDFYDRNKNRYDFYTQTQSVEDGKAVFTDLSTGLYLIIQEENAPNFGKMNPFLVSVPYLSDGEYRYDVTASIKFEPDWEPETEPTEPDTDPTDPTPTEPDTDPTDPTPTEPDTDPTDPTPTEPDTDPTDPTPTEPDTDPTDPTPTEPDTDPTDPTPTEPDTEPTTPPPTEPDEPKLPQTGQLNWPIPLMLVTGLLLFVAGWLLCFGKKKEQADQ